MQKLLEGLEGRTMFAAGSPDTFFGAAGTTKIPEISAALNPNPSGTTTTYFYPSQVLTDAAGRVVTATVESGYSIAITRLGTTGKPDLTFATHTHNQVIILNQSGDQIPPKIAIDASNRIYVLNGTVVSRYRSNGVLDSTFGKNGSVSVTALGSGKQKGEQSFVGTVDFVVDRQARVWIASEAYIDASKSLTVMEVMRLTASGTLDKSFMGGGIYVVPVPGPGTYLNRTAYVQAIKLMSDGSVVAVANAQMNQPTTNFNSTGVEVAKFTAAGTLDSTYGDGGLSVYRINAQANVHGQDDGLFGEFALLNDDGSVTLKTVGLPSPVRLNADGKTVVSVNIYDSNGVPVGIDAIATEADGSKWVWDDYSTLSGRSDQELYHLLADNTIDPDFNGGQPIKGVTDAIVANDGTILYVQGDSPDVDVRVPGPDTRPIVSRLFADEGPVARYDGGLLQTASKDYVFSLLWRDDDGLDASSLDGNDIYLRAHGFTGRGRVVSKVVQSDGEVLVTYAIRGPDNRWTAANNGPFTLSVQTRSVKDAAGNFATSRPIGVLTVAIA